MARAFLIVMDSAGIGGAPDASTFFNGDVPDTGACTLGHIAQACTQGRANEGRRGPLNVPSLAAMGLGDAIRLASGEETGLPSASSGRWGAATEISRGKDTPSGHWEIAGVPVPWDWHYFPDTDPAFPPEIIDLVKKLAGTDGTLGNTHASGTAIIEELGARHLETGWPICYTSVDSVFQIAAHEDVFGLERLLKLCKALAPTLHEMKVGRVIARPFVGKPGSFTRTANRKDFAIAPPAPTLLDRVAAADRETYGLGKIGDIFSMHGIGKSQKGRDSDLMAHLSDLIDTAADGSLTFANFVEFDTEFGHRRDVAGYARALEWFDLGIARILPRLRVNDLLLITADHGNDPTWIGTDHTRERVPVLISGAGLGSVGLVGFCDIGASVAAHLGVGHLGHGRSFL